MKRVIELPICIIFATFVSACSTGGIDSSGLQRLNSLITPSMIAVAAYDRCIESKSNPETRATRRLSGTFHIELNIKHERSEVRIMKTNVESKLDVDKKLSENCVQTTASQSLPLIQTHIDTHSDDFSKLFGKTIVTNGEIGPVVPTEFYVQGEEQFTFRFKKK